MLSSDRRTALEKFLRNNVQDIYGMNEFLAWADRAEYLMRRVSALKSDPVLTAPASQTTTTQTESMHLRWHYFAWYVEPKDPKARPHSHDLEVKRRIIDAQVAEREREAALKPSEKLTFFGSSHSQ